MELGINRVRINRSQPVSSTFTLTSLTFGANRPQESTHETRNDIIVFKIKQCPVAVLEFSPKGVGQLPKWVYLTYYFAIFAENCVEMKEFGPRGGASLAPLDCGIQATPIQMSKAALLFYLAKCTLKLFVNEQN